MKMVLVACGTALATSSIVAKAIEEAAAEAGLSIDTRQCKVSDIAEHAHDVDLIVATAQVPQGYGVPVISGMPLLTGIEKEETLAQILQALRA